MGDNDKVTLNRTGPGSTPQEPLAFISKTPISDFERWTLISERRGGAVAEPEKSGGIAVSSELDSTTPPLAQIRYRMSIQRHPIFFPGTNISNIGESVLSALRR